MGFCKLKEHVHQAMSANCHQIVSLLPTCHGTELFLLIVVR